MKKKISEEKDKINHLIGKPVAAYENFNELIKINEMSDGDGEIDPQKWPVEWKTIYYKSYGRFKEIILPKPKLNSRQSFTSVLINRKSTRSFSKRSVNLQKISDLLYYSAGINKKLQDFESRFYPSPGARFPLEVYVLSLNTSLEKGLYHYYVKNHSLERLFDFDKKDFPKILAAPWAKDAGFIIFISAVFIRNTMKYRDRGYRMLIAESGHMAQNFYLSAALCDLGICAIGGFVDNEINKILELDGVEESVIYTLIVGEVK